MTTLALRARLGARHLFVLLPALISCDGSGSVGPNGPGSGDRPQIELLPTYGATAGSTGFTLVVHGHQLREGSAVQWNAGRRSPQSSVPRGLAPTTRLPVLAGPARS